MFTVAIIILNSKVGISALDFNDCYHFAPENIIAIVVFDFKMLRHTFTNVLLMGKSLAFAEPILRRKDASDSIVY